MVLKYHLDICHKASTIHKLFRIADRTGITSRLGSVIYRDGAYYYVYLFVFSMLNIFFTAKFEPAKRVIVLSLERCLHSMFASCVLLHMRAQAKHPEPEWSTAGVDLGSGPAHTRGQSIGIMKSQTKGKSVDGYVKHIRSFSYEMKDLEKA